MYWWPFEECLPMSAEMGRKKEGYGWAVSAGINAALAAIAAKFFYNQVLASQSFNSTNHP